MFPRKYKKRLGLLLLITGWLCLVIAGLMGLMNVFRPSYEQARFARITMIYASAGGGLLLVYVLLFVLPKIIERRSSITYKRRYGSRVRRSVWGRGPERDGSILVFVMVLMGLVASMAVHIAMTAQNTRLLTSTMVQSGLLRMAALDSVRAVMQELADDDDLLVDHPGEAWALTREVTDPAGITRFTRVRDLQAGFDLNNLAVQVTGPVLRPGDALAGVMTACGVFTPGRLVDALRDWIDRDETGGYENFHYQRLDPPYLPANRILYGMHELLYVAGWEASLFARRSARLGNRMFEGDLIDHVVILPASRDRVIPLNVNTATDSALMGLLGLGSEPAVEWILSRRREAPITRLDYIWRWLGEDGYQRIAPYLDVRSSWFHIQTTAYHQDGRRAQLNLVAYRDNDGRVSAVKASF